MDNTEDTQYITVSTAAARLGITPAAVYYLINTGLLHVTIRYGVKTLNADEVANYRPRGWRPVTNNQAAATR